MGETPKSYSKMPTLPPGVPSNRKKPFPCISKRLYLDGPRLFRNGLGEHFTFTTQNLYPGGYDLTLKARGREAGELTINVSIRASRKENKVSISSISCRAQDNPNDAYSRPSGENRGYGIVRLAIQFAKRTARELGITRITIQPYCRALHEHYAKSGFREEPVSGTIRKHEMVMHLKD
jgi:GNAT superfamily N-acetyltransferase